MSWKVLKTKGDPPSERIAHTLNLVNSKLYVYGGFSGIELDDLYMLDLKTQYWKQYTPKDNEITPGRRNNHASTVHGTNIYVHGGYNGVSWLNDMYMYDTIQEKWYKIDQRGKVIEKRACHTLNCIGNYIFLFGGFDGESQFNQIEIFNIQTQTWENRLQDDLSPMPRHLHCMVEWGTKLVLYGGVGSQDPRRPHFLDDLWVFNAQTLTWEQVCVRGIRPMGLKNNSGNVIGNGLVIVGGYGPSQHKNKLTEEIKVCDLTTMTWYDAQDVEGVIPVMTHKACNYRENKLLIFGGYTTSEKWLNEVYMFDTTQMKLKDRFKKAYTLYDKNILMGGSGTADQLQTKEALELCFSSDEEKVQIDEIPYDNTISSEGYEKESLSLSGSDSIKDEQEEEIVTSKDQFILKPSPSKSSTLARTKRKRSKFEDLNSCDSSSKSSQNRHSDDDDDDDEEEDFEESSEFKPLKGIKQTLGGSLSQAFRALSGGAQKEIKIQKKASKLVNNVVECVNSSLMKEVAQNGTKEFIKQVSKVSIKNALQKILPSKNNEKGKKNQLGILEEQTQEDQENK